MNFAIVTTIIIVLYKYSYIYILFILFNFSTYAQKRYPVEIYEKSQSSIHNVYDVQSNVDRYIWFVSHNGLCRYDGIQFKYFVNSKMSTKAGSSLQFDDKNRPWYNTFDGEIYYLERDSLVKFNVVKNEAFEFKLLDNHLWITQNGEIRRYSVKDSSSQHIAYIKPRSIVRYSDRYIFIFDQNTHYVQVRYFCGYIYKEILLDESFNNKVIDYDNDFFVIKKLEDSIQVLKITDQNFELVATIPTKYSVTNSMLNGDYLSICTKGGYIQLSLKDYTWESNDLDYNVLNCFIDSRNNEWIGTSSGLFKYSTAQMNNLLELNTTEYYFIPFMDTFLISNFQGQLFTYKDKKLNYLFQSRGQSQIYDVDEVLNNDQTNILISNRRLMENNVFPFNGKKFFIPISSVKSMVRLDHKYLAIAQTGSCELVKCNFTSSDLPSIWDSLFLQKGEKDIAVLENELRGKQVAYDSINKRILFSTSMGLTIYMPHKKTNVLYRGEEIYAKNIASIDGRFLVLSHLGELVIINPDGKTEKLAHLSAHLPIVNFRNYGDHIIFWNEKNMYSAEFSKLHSEVTIEELFHILSPLPPIEFSDVYFNDTRLYIVYRKTLIEVLLSGMIKKKPDFEFNWDKVTVTGKTFIPNEEIVISSKLNFSDFHFSIIDFDREVYSLEYRLNDGEWKPIMPDWRKIGFSAITPGDYVLKMRVNGIEQDKVIRFKKLAPWYKQVWFNITLIGLALLGAILYFKHRLNIYEKENQLIIEKNKLEANLRQSLLSSLKSQMNPHFLFNALNAIQSYIITEDKANASKYLTLFARLTRMILEMSDKEYAVLESELKAVNLYVELELMRFPEIKYEYHLEKNINPLNVFVPSMIIQPFVENALKHGLMHKVGEKRMSLKVSIEDEKLLIKIKDNGIGREKSRILNERKKSHQSFATQANIKRLELLNLDKNEILWHYNDLKDEMGEPCGTEVILKIPIKKHNHD